MTTNKTSYPFTSKKQIVARIAVDAAYRMEALVILYNLQTQHEQDTETTLNRNRQGFMSSHAVHGCRLAKKYLAGEEMTPEDEAKIAEIVPRYGRQLAAWFRNEKIAAEPELAETAAIFGIMVKPEPAADDDETVD